MTLAACNGDPKAPNQGNESGTIEGQQPPEDLKLKSALVGRWSGTLNGSEKFIEFLEEGTMKSSSVDYNDNQYKIIKGTVFVVTTNNETADPTEYIINEQNQLIYQGKYTYNKTDNSKGLLGTWKSADAYPQEWIFNADGKGQAIGYDENEPEMYMYFEYTYTDSTFTLLNGSQYRKIFTLKGPNDKEAKTSFKDSVDLNLTYTKETNN